MVNKFYFDREYKCWIHRTRLKLIVNPILRKLQFFTKKPWVIASIVDMKDGVPKFIKYSLYRTECKGDFDESRCDVYVNGKKVEPYTDTEGCDIC